MPTFSPLGMLITKKQYFLPACPAPKGLYRLKRGRLALKPRGDPLSLNQKRKKK
jgi:hypothetical protein